MTPTEPDEQPGPQPPADQSRAVRIVAGVLAVLVVVALFALRELIRHLAGSH